MPRRKLKRPRENYGELESTSEAESMGTDLQPPAQPRSSSLIYQGSDTDVQVNGQPDAPFDDIGIKELLEHDSRPTFVLDLHALGQAMNGPCRWCSSIALLGSSTNCGT